VVFSNTAMNYKVLGDGVNTFNSSGSYTYTTNGSQGNAAIVDNAISNGNFILTFTSSTTGTYQATAEFDANSNQTGSFIVLWQSLPSKRIKLDTTNEPNSCKD